MFSFVQMRFISAEAKPLSHRTEGVYDALGPQIGGAGDIGPPLITTSQVSQPNQFLTQSIHAPLWSNNQRQRTCQKRDDVTAAKQHDTLLTCAQQI
jgi:hypothetical protein